MSSSYFNEGLASQQVVGPMQEKKFKDTSKRYYQKYGSLTDKQKKRAGSKEEFIAKKQELGLKGVNVEKDTKTRMAGDALNQMRSREKDGVTNSKKYNENTVDQMNQQVYGVENINDFDAAASGAGAGKNINRLSNTDIKGLQKEGGFSRKEILQYVEDNPDVDASGKKAQKLLGRYKDRIAANQKEKESASTNPVETTPTPEPVAPPATAPEPTPTTPNPTPNLTPNPTPNPTPNLTPNPTPNPTPEDTNPTPSPGAEINAPVSSSTGNVKSRQDASIVGDNNSINQETNIDNSSTVYGGSSRIFNYTGGSNPATDTPVSAATMGGFYDVDDSASANASRLDRQIGQNQDAQKYWQQNAASIAADAIRTASANTSINPDAIDERLVNSEQDSFDRATLMGANIFGDMAAYGGAPTFKPAKPPKPVEQPDFEGMYDKYTNF